LGRVEDSVDPSRPSRPRRRASSLGGVVALLPLALVACSSGPPPLEIVPAEAPLEPAPAPRFLLELRVSGAVEVALPPNDSSQRIESLFWVVPRGEYELVEDEGRRLLKTSADASLELKVRFALPEREQPALSSSLAARLRQKPAPRDPDSAPERDLRYVTILDWSGARPGLSRVAEARVGDDWWRYSPERGELLPPSRALSFGDVPLRGLEAASFEVRSLDEALAAPNNTREDGAPGPLAPRGS